MSKYTAPQRTTSKRQSLSRRTQIFILASLLVPVSLLAIANLPASAAAKFATLQDVQDAIIAALAPINSAIASLQQQQTGQEAAITGVQNTLANHTSQISDLQTQQQNQAQQISNLQSSTGKSLKVYDANGQELGLANTFDGGNATIYSPALARFIYLRIGNLMSFDGTFEPNGNTSYQSNDCTGTPYLNADQTSAYNSLFAGPDNFYIVPNSETTTTITVHSIKYFDISAKQFSCCPSPTCTLGPPGTIQAYQMHQVTLPFSTPLALPLQFKYQ